MKRLVGVLLVLLVATVLVVGLWLALGLLWPMPIAEPGARAERLVVRNIALVDVCFPSAEVGHIRGSI